MIEINPYWNKLSQESRLYQMPVPIVGLTGGIASGKSSVSKILNQKYNIKIIDADRLVKSIYQKEQTLAEIAKLVPTAIHDSLIDFKKLREAFFSDSHLQSKIETLIYSQMPQAFTEEYKNNVEGQQNFIIYDVPLLFEKNLTPGIDVKVCVWCPRQTQIKRLMIRDGIDQELALKILDKQWDIDKKRDHSDLVIDNSSSEEAMNTAIQGFISKLLLIK